MATKKKPPSDEVEVSVPLIPDKTWSFRYNDERVTFEQWKQLNEDHKRWVKEQESKSSADTELPSKKRAAAVKKKARK